MNGHEHERVRVHVQEIEESSKISSDRLASGSYLVWLNEMVMKRLGRGGVRLGCVVRGGSVEMGWVAANGCGCVGVSR